MEFVSDLPICIYLCHSFSLTKLWATKCIVDDKNRIILVANISEPCSFVRFYEMLIYARKQFHLHCYHLYCQPNIPYPVIIFVFWQSSQCINLGMNQGEPYLISKVSLQHNHHGSLSSTGRSAVDVAVTCIFEKLTIFKNHCYAVYDAPQTPLYISVISETQGVC